MKIIIIGPPGCGKSSIYSKICFDSILPQQTVGCDYAKKNIIVDKQSREIYLWDIAASELESPLMKIYLKDTLGVFLVCDIESEQSIKELKEYKNKVDLFCQQYNDSGLPMIILQNKIDLLTKNHDHEDHMLPEYIYSYAQKNGYVTAYQTSAYTGEGLRDAFETMIKEIDSRNLKSLLYKTTRIQLGANVSVDFTQEIARINKPKDKCY